MKKILFFIIINFLITENYINSSDIVQNDNKDDSTSSVYKIEDIIDQAYINCIKWIPVDGIYMKFRIPFGQNEERFISQRIFYGGKGNPQVIWPEIIRLTKTEDFRKYINTIKSEGSKIVVFNLIEKNWISFSEELEILDLPQDPYPGSKDTVYLFKNDSNLTSNDLYNYLYCVGSIGMDCSGFVYYIQKSITKALGTDLDEILGIRMKREPEYVSHGVGLSLYSAWPEEWETVNDRITDLRPGDMILFSGWRKRFSHSAVIQSIDWAKGEIIYVQSTDWTPQYTRGVHKSYIYFNPDNPDISISDKSVRWTQRIYPAFIGEPGFRYWRTDGDRYRSYKESGGSSVIRSKFVRNLIEKKFPYFYKLTPKKFELKITS